MSKHYVGVADPKLVFVTLEDRSEFDKIGLPAKDHAANERGGQVISKTVKTDDVMIVFQHWTRQPGHDNAPTDPHHGGKIWEDDGDIGAGLVARDPDMSDYKPDHK